jgi:hypothetical protein
VCVSVFGWLVGLGLGARLGRSERGTSKGGKGAVGGGMARVLFWPEDISSRVLARARQRHDTQQGRFDRLRLDQGGEGRDVN